MNPVPGVAIGYINGRAFASRHVLIDVYNDDDGAIRMDLAEPVEFNIPERGEFSVSVRVGDARVPLLAIHQMVDSGGRLAIEPPARRQ